MLGYQQHLLVAAHTTVAAISVQAVIVAEVAEVAVAWTPTTAPPLALLLGLVLDSQDSVANVLLIAKISARKRSDGVFVSLNRAHIIVQLVHQRHTCRNKQHQQQTNIVLCCTSNIEKT